MAAAHRKAKDRRQHHESETVAADARTGKSKRDGKGRSVREHMQANHSQMRKHAQMRPRQHRQTQDTRKREGHKGNARDKEHQGENKETTQMAKQGKTGGAS